MHVLSHNESDVPGLESGVGFVANKDLKIEQSGGRIVFSVKVVPGSSRTCVSGLLDGMLKVKLAAPAEKGKANKALIELLSDTFGIKKNDVKIISGETNPVKRILISGLSAEDIKSKLPE